MFLLNLALLFRQPSQVIPKINTARNYEKAIITKKSLGSLRQLAVAVTQPELWKDLLNSMTDVCAVDGELLSILF